MKRILCVIQIPCYNEEVDLPRTIADLPRTIVGVDEIAVLVVDDGSTDDTVLAARASGAHVIVQLGRNTGLAAAYSAGIEVALRLGADIIVNTDADNQYCGADIAAIVAPLVSGKADLVVGDRQTAAIPHFSVLKKWLQYIGTHVVRQLSGVPVRDATCGFRAMTRSAALGDIVHSRFSYTLESLIHAGERRLVVLSVPVRTNGQTRPSRLFKTIPYYLSRSLLIMINAYIAYHPVKCFAGMSLVFLLVGAIAVIRFVVFYITFPDHDGHTQSLVLGACSLVLGGLCAICAVIADLLAINRRLLEQISTRVRDVRPLVLHSSELIADSLPSNVHVVDSTFWPGNSDSNCSYPLLIL